LIETDVANVKYPWKEVVEIDIDISPGLKAKINIWKRRLGDEIGKRNISSYPFKFSSYAPEGGKYARNRSKGNKIKMQPLIPCSIRPLQ
jgi:hypothetical protein